LCNDVLHEPHYMHAELIPETKAELAVPLRAGNRVIGVLDVQSDRRDAFDKEDVSALQILGNQVGIALKNARLFQETKHRYEAMIALHATSLDMIARLDTTALLESLLRRGAQLLGAKGGVVYVYDTNTELSRAVASYNTSRDWYGVTVKLDEGVIGQVIRTGKPLIINDYHNWPNRAAAFEGSSETRIVGVPLKWENQIIGAFDMVNNPEGRPFDDNDVWLITQFADLASIAIKNAELHSQTRLLSQELEHKVADRTRELSNATEELAARTEQLRLLLAKTVRVQEDERARIARDMHDDVVQLITAARWEAQTAEAFAGPELNDAARAGLAATRELLDQVEKQIRRAIYDLHPPILDAVGLGSALQYFAKQFNRVTGASCRLEIAGDVVRLPLRAESSIYRLVEEALANIATHARCTESCVVLDYQDTWLAISVKDNGVGFDRRGWAREPSRTGSGLGLLSMQERAEGLGGSMEVDSAPDCGTRLTFRIPIERGAAE
jgi:signal transduction histidine kinase